MNEEVFAEAFQNEMEKMALIGNKPFLKKTVRSGEMTSRQRKRTLKEAIKLRKKGYLSDARIAVADRKDLPEKKIYTPYIASLEESLKSKPKAYDTQVQREVERLTERMKK